MSALELRHAKLLFEIRAQAQESARVYDQQLEDYVLELRDSGAPVRGIADALGVGASTVQAWTNNARRRRDG